MGIDMELGLVQVYGGNGHGKSATALGKAIKYAGKGKNVVIIRFLKGSQYSDFYKRLEPEIKIFCFEKSEGLFELLTDEQKQEEIDNIRNGLNFAKKVLTTDGCDLLVLDEVLGLIDNNIITIEDLKHILDVKSEDVSIIMTGTYLGEEVCHIADEVYRIDAVVSEND